MKSLLIFCIAIILTTSLNAAEKEKDDEKNAGKIKGKIIEKEKKSPIPFATLALIRVSDSTLVAGVISGENGEYQFENIPFDNYRLKVSFLGYKPVVVDGISLSRRNRNIEIPQEETALREEAKLLDEVVVTRERLKGEEKIDRTVFTINDDVRTNSSTGLDVLKHVPSVNVDFQENVSLEGQSNIHFYVDGVLRNKDFVAQLAPSSIDKVEIITNPGVQYSADVSGVINIVLKKERNYGVSGSFRLPIVHPTKIIANPYANLEYGNQKFRVYAGDRLHWEQFYGKEYLETRLDETNPDPYDLEKVSEGDLYFRRNYLNYGIDWFINDQTTLNFLGEYWNSGEKQDDYLNETTIFRDDSVSNYYKTLTDNTSSRNTYYFSLFLKRKLGEESELTAEAFTYLQSSLRENNYRETYYSYPFEGEVADETHRFEITDNFTNTAEGRINYSFATPKMKHEMGARVKKLWMNNDFNRGYFIEENPYESDEDFSYTEFRQVGYYNLTGKLKEFSWQTGVRGEHSGFLIQDSTNTDYFVFLPQVSMSYNLENKQSLKFSYRRQIFRPSAQNLNPFVSWMDSLHLRKGNPDLVPSYQNRAELTYAKNIGSNYISPKLYLRYTKDGIRDLTEINDNGVSVITQANIGEELQYGLGLNFAIQLFKIWRINGNMNVYDTRLESSQELALEEYNQMVSYSYGINSSVMLPKDFSFNVYSYYNSPRIAYQREMIRDPLLLFGVTKKIKDNWKIDAMYNPLIKDFVYHGTITRAPGFYESHKGVLNVQHLFAIEITYNFNTGKKIKKLNRSADYERESSGGAL